MIATPVTPYACRSEDYCRRKFEAFKTAYRKEYVGQIEHDHRRSTFCNSLKEIEQINAAGLTWRAGVNQYSDLAEEEFMDRFTMKEPQNCSATISRPVSSLVSLSTVPPATVDWRNETCGETSCVSMVKNQGSCGSCWTFSTVAALEATHAINRKMMILLSEQQVGQSLPLMMRRCAGRRY